MESVKSVQEILKAVCDPEQQPHEWMGHPSELLKSLQAAINAEEPTRKQRVAAQRAKYAAQVRAEMKHRSIRGAELAHRMGITPNRVYGAFHQPESRSKEWWQKALDASRLDVGPRSTKPPRPHAK